MQAANRHVPADYATIQAAVNAAVSGDTIRIAPGVYREQTFITNKNLTLVGRPGTILRAFSVQSAPAPRGPWSTLDATPIRQNGENKVVEPVAGGQQFFRLAKP